MAGGPGDSTNDVTSRIEPWESAKPYYIALYSMIDNANNNTDKSAYPGPFFAGANSYDTSAQTAVNQAALNLVSDVLKLRTHAQNVLDGDFVDHSSNPHIANAVSAALDEPESRLTSILLPQIIDRAIQVGAYGGPAQQLIETVALEDFSKEAIRTSSKIYYENHVRERTLQDAAFQMYSTIQAMEGMRVKLIQANADMVRGLAQITIDDAAAAREEAILAPWRGLPQYAEILNGGGFAAKTEEAPKKNVLGSALQGAVGGASTGAAVGGAPGAAIGAALGAITGGLL